MAEENGEFIPTKGSSLNKNVKEVFQIVTYESYKSKSKNKVKGTLSDAEGNVLDMKRARHEIIKFGLSGFDTQKKEEAKIQLAIKLGAKPPKNKYKNYKELLTEKKTEKLLEKSRMQMQALHKSTLKSKKYNYKKKIGKGNILHDYGKVTEQNNNKFVLKK